MSNRYMMKYKGKYRLLSPIDTETNDFPRTPSGDVEEDLEIYITCQHGSKIYAYGTDGHKEMQLAAYVPSLGRGRNVRKAMDKEKIEYYAYDETDEEVTVRVTVNLDAMRKWALQYALHVKVLKPERLVNLLKEDVKRVAEQYGFMEQ